MSQYSIQNHLTFNDNIDELRKKYGICTTQQAR